MALFVAMLLSIGSAFIVECVEIGHKVDMHHAMHSHEDLSTPQKHSPYADHNDSSHLHIYQIEVQAVFETLHNLDMSAKSEPADNAAIETLQKFSSQVATSQRLYFASQYFQIPLQYNSAFHSSVIILV